MNGREAHGSDAVDVTTGSLPPPRPDIASSAARIGAYVWLGHRLFEVMGRWATTSPEPAVTLYFAGTARRFADQAGHWVERLPRLSEAPRERLERAPGPSSEAIIEFLVATESTDRRLAALDFLVAALDEVYAKHQEACSPVRDASVASMLVQARNGLEGIRAARPFFDSPVTVDTFPAVSSRDDGDGRFGPVTGRGLFT